MNEERTPNPAPPPDAGHLPMGEELDRASWTLPPLRLVAIILAALAVVVVLILWAAQPAPVSGGRIDRIGVVEQRGGERVLVAVHVTVENIGEKPLFIRNIKADLRSADGEWSDDASSAVDHERYYTAYPELRQHSGEPLLPETEIPRGGTRSGLVIFGFPVSRQAFEERQSFTVTVDAYDRRPLVLSDPRAAAQ